MDNIGAMDVEASSQELVHKILAMIVSEVLSRVNDSMHICFHEVSNDVDIFESCLSWWLLNIHQTNNVLMIKEF